MPSMAYTIFKLPIGYRLYDREKNKIISVSYEEYIALKNIIQGKPSEEDQKLLCGFQEKGFCRESRLQEIEHPATGKIQSIVEKGLNQIVLQVTQNCNLRCSYCAYSGSYYNRKHSNKRMSKETALRAVDFFMEHSSEIEDATIGFYGGEPLLEIDLIREVISYVEENYPERKVRYNLTTNLTLLTKEILDFFVEKNVVIMISIDGPKEIQDRNRMFVSGTGSFSTVITKAEEIQKNSPDYFKQCMTNTVMSPGSDYEKVIDFLDNDRLFGQLTSLYSLVNDVDIKEELQYDDTYNQTVHKEIFKIYLARLGELEYSQVSRLMKTNVSAIFETNQFLQMNGTANMRKSHPGGPCIPGSNRLFVDVEGFFYPCERIAENPALQIGNLDEGYSLDRINRMLNIGKMTEEQCLNCWAFMYCGTCAANMTEHGIPSKKIRLKRCSGERTNIQNRLANLEMMRYYGFDFMQGEE